MVNHSLLRYVFPDGSNIDTEWENPSRSESWTPEMKRLAAEHQKEIMKKRKETAEHED